jgi:flagellar basal body-associated protein FliL
LPAAASLPHRCRRLFRRIRGKQARKAALLAALAVVAGGTALFAAAQQIRSGSEVVVAIEAMAMHEFPEMIADLKENGARSAYVKLVIVVEIPEGGRSHLETNETMILSALRGRLRDYQRKDLVGKAGAERLRTDLLAIVNGAIAPAAATDILFKELLLN